MILCESNYTYHHVLFDNNVVTSDWERRSRASVVDNRMRLVVF